VRKYTLIFFCILGFHLLILSQLQFTAWPEMVSFPYLINHGFILYEDAIHAYPSLLVSILSVLYKLFGYKLIVLKFFGWISILTSDVLIFIIINKLTKEKLAVYGVLVYVILQPILEGNMVWPDLFIVPFLLLTFLLLFKGKYFFAGIAIGLAILTKQTGVLFLTISGIWLLAYERKNLKNILNYVLGVLVIVLPFLVILLRQNAMSDFINWTIIYPSKYWTKFPGYVQLSPTLRENLILLVLLLPLAILILKSSKKIFSDKMFLLLFSFLVAGIIGVYPRFSFFHFQSALVFLVILIFYLSKIFKFWLLVIPICVLILSFKSLQFSQSRFWTNEDINLGQIIEKETVQGKPIYLLGLSSQLYVFSNRLPNKLWLDNFGWYLEIPGVQQQVVNSFTNNPPSVIFWRTPDSGNWYDIGVYQPKMITDWIKKNYYIKMEVQKGIWEWVKR
jgi:4-amino-4-deoxy-L-arabinose transferase-like glycosyltransferase